MEFLTSGAIAERLKVDRDAVCYALRKMKVEPKGRAGQVRIFPESALELTKEFLSSRKERKVCSE